MIGKLSAIDYDMVNPLRESDIFLWSLVNPNDHFVINGSYLVLAKQFQDNKNVLHEVTVKCSDKNLIPKSSTKKILIQYVNVNSHPVNLTLEIPKLLENASLNSTVGKLIAVDLESNDVRFKDLSESDEKSTFYIKPTVCTFITASDSNYTECMSDIVLLRPLDYETKLGYTLKIQAVDTKNEFQYKEFSIKISDVNEKPYDIQITHDSVDENSPGALVGGIQVFDHDASQKHRCQVEDGSSPFEMRGLNIVLKPDRSLNFEAKKSYNISINCTDSGSPPLSFTKTLEIFVKDRNDPPTGLSVNWTTIYDGMKNQIIGEITVSDVDKAQDIVCKVLYQTNEQKLVAIEKIGSRNMVKLLNTALDFETKPRFTFKFQCFDIGVTNDRNFSTSINTITLTVKDVNESPHSPCLQSIYISYNVTVGAFVKKLVSKDPDNERFYRGESTQPKQTLSYLLHTNPNLPFKLNNANFVMVDGVLEQNKEYNFQVQITDNGKLARYEKNDFIYYKGIPKSGIFTCSIVAVDPSDLRVLVVIVLTNNKIPENADTGTEVGKFKIQETNVTKPFIFEISNKEVTPFKIIKDKLFLSNSTVLDYETKNTYQLIITAFSNDDGETFQKLFDIKVVDSNDPPTRMCISNTTVMEGLPVGSTIAQILIEDPDFPETKDLCNQVGSTIFRQKYECSIHPMSNTKFPLNINKNLVIQNVENIFYRMTDHIMLTISCRDKTKGDIVIQKSFDIQVTESEHCNGLFQLATTGVCECKKDLSGMKCDRNASLCTNQVCSSDDVCSTFIRASNRCASTNHQIPILLRTPFAIYASGDFQDNLEKYVEAIVEGNTTAKTVKDVKARKKRSNGDNVYIEAGSAQAVVTSTVSFTYIQFIPMDEKKSYNLMLGERICPRFKNSDLRCLNSEDCAILQSAGISCPRIFGNGYSDKTGHNSSNSDMDSWVYGVIVAIVVLLLIIAIVSLVLKRYHKPLKQHQDTVGFDATTNSLNYPSNRLRNNLHSSLERPCLDNQPVPFSSGGNQTLRDLYALRQKTNILVFQNQIFKPNDDLGAVASSTFEIHNPSYGVHSATNHAFIDDGYVGGDDRQHAETHIYASIGKSTKNLFYENPYNKVDLLDEDGKEDTMDRKVDISDEKLNTMKDKFNTKDDNVTLNDVMRGKRLPDDEPDDLPSACPIIRGLSVNQFSPEDDNKNKTFKKSNLHDDDSNC